MSNVIFTIHLALLHQDPFKGNVSIENWGQRLIEVGSMENRKEEVKIENRTLS